MQNLCSGIRRYFIYHRRSRKHIFSVIIILLLLSTFFTNIRLRNPYNDPLSAIQSQPKCSDLFNENTDPTIFKAAESWTVPANEKLTDIEVHQKISSDCSRFLKEQNYFLTFSNRDEELDFRIAYSIVVYKNASQVERLLRMIYRPWNYYCLHVDLKSDSEFVGAVTELVNCLNSEHRNIISTDNRVAVKWGELSVLTADLNCMRELYRKYSDWKYLINLTGQEFPLKTNWELVKILRAFKGANNVDGTYKKRNKVRVPTGNLSLPIVWFKGAVHITVNRDFIEFIVTSNKSRILLGALANGLIPDEQFFATLNYNVQLRIPGSFIGNPDEYHGTGDSVSFYVTRYKNRGEYLCMSKEIVRGLCIWGAGDLPNLVRVPHLFSNKFYEDFQPITLRCLEEWYYSKVRKELSTNRADVNDTFYSSLPFVKYRYIAPGN